MKKPLTLSAILWIVITFFSCHGSTDLGDEVLNHYKKIYNLAISINDYSVAENAIYNEWALDTVNTLIYKDTLAHLYIRNRQFIPAIIIGKEILIKRPGDMDIMELLGVADQNINYPEDALAYYQKIYSKTHDLFHLYKIAVIQYDLNRSDECNQTIDQIVADSGSLHQLIPIQGQTTTQNVPYRAAALNMRGVMARDIKHTDVAKKAFNDALAIDPFFELAKNNLEELNK